MLAYQVRWIADQSRFRIALKARQIRWSTTVAYEAFVGATFRGRRQLIVSASERQAQEVLSKVKGWGKIASAAGVPVRYATENTTELCVEGGSPIISLAQNPATIEGFSGDVTLDEFSKHPRHKEIYDAIFPSITAGYRISVVGVPYGQDGTFYDLWSKFPSYSKHKTTIHEAIRDGLKVDLDALRSGMDADAFRAAFECEFVDESTAFFPYELLLRNVGECPAESGEVFVGVDVGRKRDMTVIYALKKLGDKFYTRRVECLRGVEFDTQRKAILQVYREEKAGRMAIDATGMGSQLAEQLKRDVNAEGVTFTAPLKEEMAHKVKRLLEDRVLQLPDDKELIADIHSVRRTVTSAGNFRFDAERTEDGHADRFWALAVAIHAADNLTEPRVSFI